MLATLPDFTPRDSHSLWYTSSRSASQPHNLHDTQHHGDLASHSHAQAPSRSRGHILERTALARLAADEQHMHRRRIHVQNFGSTWLRPLGVPKTLHQMREEKRELEEHQEALRREQLAQEYAEAAAGGDDAEEGLMDDVQLDGAQDLDDEIPDADTAGGLFAMDADSDDSDDDDDDDDDGGEDVDEDRGVQDVQEAEDESELDDEARREERQNDLMAARMRMTDDAFREALVRGDPDGDDMYGGEEELRAEHQGHMLDEDDFAHDSGGDDHVDDGLVDMDADLDDDIPEAESGLYEHTDSQAELSSSEGETRHDDDDDDDDDDDEQDDFDFAPRTTVLGPPQSPTLRGRRMSAGPRESMDLSNLLSQDESSLMQSSPAQRRSR
ncbi:hypothetical protein E4U53_002799 [Claviceps sorghi]|nr:hypothetical protein E4U53_002799 [Claviceps sorghi]